MATLTPTEVSTLVKNALVINTSTDSPIDWSAGAEGIEAINSAYQMVWESSGGRIVRATHSTLWGTLTAGISAGTTATQAVQEIVTLLDSVGGLVIEPTEYDHIQFLRGSTGLGTYGVPKVYSAVRLQTATEANQGNLELHVWPHVTGAEFLTHYVPQFIPCELDGDPGIELNDIESRDVAWLAALILAPRLGRAELMPQLALMVSEHTQKALDRRIRAMLEGAQDS